MSGADVGLLMAGFSLGLGAGMTILILVKHYTTRS